MPKVKPEYHQSRLKNYFKCPAMFKLSMEIEPEIGTGTMNVLREGQLFEGYVFGFKDDKEEDELIGRKKPATIQGLKDQAAHVAPIFDNGASYQKILLTGKEYDLAGEIDFLGQLDWDYINDYTGMKHDAVGESINDLKKTGSISYVWSAFQRKIDFIQACMYTYIHFRNTGDVLPFVYIIVEDTYAKPIVKIKKIFFDGTSFAWLEKLINQVHNDLFYHPHASFDSCEGGRGGSRCWWLQHCEKGRQYIGEMEILHFNDLK